VTLREQSCRIALEPRGLAQSSQLPRRLPRPELLAALSHSSLHLIQTSSLEKTGLTAGEFAPRTRNFTGWVRLRPAEWAATL